jgi:hypothetical protein
MPPIPTVLVHSFLFLVCLCASFDDETIDMCAHIYINVRSQRRVEKMEKRGHKSSWSGNMEEA